MKSLIEGTFLMEKYPGKGGWTFVRLPPLKSKIKNAFHWKKVKGSIDGFEISHYHLMPMQDGNLFLPVRAEIRKKIHKEAGDKVLVILFPHPDPIEVPEEFLMCLRDDPTAQAFFHTLSDSEKKYYVQWIYAAKRPETKINRMAKSIERLHQGKKLYAPEK